MQKSCEGLRTVGVKVLPRVCQTRRHINGGAGGGARFPVLAGRGRDPQGSQGSGQGRQSAAEGRAPRARGTARRLKRVASLVEDSTPDMESDYQTTLERLQDEIAELKKGIADVNAKVEAVEANARTEAANLTIEAINLKTEAANKRAEAADLRLDAAKARAEAASANARAVSVEAELDIVKGEVAEAFLAINEGLKFVERGPLLKALAQKISAIQKIVVNFYDDPTKKYAEARVDEMPPVEPGRFKEVMDQLLRSGQDPPAHVLEAIRARLKKNKTGFSDPLEFLKDVDSYNFDVLRDKVHRAMRAYDLERAMRARRLFKDLEDEDWSEPS